MDEFGMLAGSNVLEVAVGQAEHNPHWLMGELYRLYKNKNTVEYYFDAIENKFYTIAWHAFDWNNQSEEGYTLQILLKIKCLKSDDVTPYFDYTWNNQFDGTPRPIKAKGTGKVYLHVRTRYNNETAQGLLVSKSMNLIIPH
jgi:hypothetical protein